MYFRVSLVPDFVLCDGTLSCSVSAGAALQVETHHVFLSLSENPGQLHTPHANTLGLTRTVSPTVAALHAGAALD